jgi:threonylcarbamoyladenosine tRNA methylthiotransferase MtaB
VSETAARKVEVVTFGCRLNLVESEAMRRAAGAAAGGGDLVIVNTCAVTAEAGRQARQAIRRLRRERPEAEIVVTGCGVEVETARFADMPEVSRIVGNAVKTSSEAWAPEAAASLRVGDVMSLRETAGHFLDGLDGHTRGFLQVQNGCDHRCTFCVIPFGRGPSRSAPLAQVVEEAKKLVAAGALEIVLTGVDLTSWGDDLPGSPRLGRLVQTLLKHVPDLPRLRLSSIDCIEADAALFEAMAGERRLMPHLHLSLQAGDDMILKRMKRRHMRADAVRLCADLRAARPEIVFGADLIAGFPTETEAMFQNTLVLVGECGLTHLHVFPFSPRPGTPAAKMPQVGRDAVKDRAKRLRATGAEALQRHLRAQIGKRLSALTERGGVARAEDFTLVKMPDAEAGRLIDVEISGVAGEALVVANAGGGR